MGMTNIFKWIVLLSLYCIWQPGVTQSCRRKTEVSVEKINSSVVATEILWSVKFFKEREREAHFKVLILSLSWWVHVTDVSRSVYWPYTFSSHCLKKKRKGFEMWASWGKKRVFTFKRKRELWLRWVSPGLLCFNLMEEEIDLKNRLWYRYPSILEVITGGCFSEILWKL